MSMHQIQNNIGGSGNTVNAKQTNTSTSNLITSQQYYNTMNNPFGLCNSDKMRQDYLGIMGSSVIGGMQQQPSYDINQDDDCGELVVGLHDGQS